MLVLSRKTNQRIIIQVEHQLVEVVVVSIRGNVVRLGIEAPPEVTVHRREIAEAIKREQDANR